LKVVFDINAGSQQVEERANYAVIETDYQTHALVYSCTEVFPGFKVEFAWILSRTRALPQEIIERLEGRLNEGVRSKLVGIQQSSLVCEA
jgi:hypothetical protein